MVRQWFDIRPGEGRPVFFSFFGACFVISFLILSRSLSESLYLEAFAVTTLPYITASAALLGIPAVGLFSRWMTKRESRAVYRAALFCLIAAVGILIPFVAGSPPVVVAFYLVTNVGTMLITAGFWIVTSEQFPLRGAKRLFGLISAGGTLGAMVTGNSIKWLTREIDYLWLLAGLVVILLLSLVSLFFLPKTKGESSGVKATGPTAGAFREGLRLIRSNPHLKYIALIVIAATIASTLVDYQFKDLVKGTLKSKEELAGFFGAFYGWTGGISLAIQIFAASRMISGAGLALTLSVLPLLLLLGSSGLLFAPMLMVATLVRGADNSLRKSLHRSALEVLYVPLDPEVRKKTKTFIDSTLNSAAETIGAGIIFLWVTWGGLPARFLSFFIGAFSIFLLYLSRRISRIYVATLSERLKAGGELLPQAPFENRDLLTASISRETILRVTNARRGFGQYSVPSPLRGEGQGEGGEPIACGDEVTVLIEQLGQDPLYERAVQQLESLGLAAKGALVRAFCDPSTDFIIRRRIPRLLASLADPEVDEALAAGLLDHRFEIRFRSAIAISRRAAGGLAIDPQKLKETVFGAIHQELKKDRAVLEFQQILDRIDEERDDFVTGQVGQRGVLSLEHIFRLLSLVEDPAVVHSAYRGLTGDEEKLKSISLEYLEHLLPVDLKQALWPFIGDMSESQKERSKRPMEEVEKDLLATSVTLFADEKAKAALKKMLSSRK